MPSAPTTGVVAALVIGLVVAMVGAFAAEAHAATPPVEFGDKTDFATGTYPFSMVAGDVNGDSLLDVAVTNLDSNTVSVLLGDGAGAFGVRTDFPTGAEPSSVALGDVDGDSFLDLAVANYRSDTVSVLLGDGAGGFGPKMDIATDRFPVAVALGDVDGDSVLDLAVAHYFADSVSVWLGDGAGGFAPGTVVTTGQAPSDLVLRDLNGDSSLDLAVANADSDSVSVLLGDGSGGFGARTDIPSASLSFRLVAGDVNGDTVPDLAVAGLDTVSVLLGDGEGGFGAKTEFAAGPGTVAMGDVNGDTFPDLAVSVADNPSGVSVLLGDGAGGFGRSAFVSTSPWPSFSLVLGELNGDAFPDLVVADAGLNAVSVLLNTGAVAAAPTVATAIAGVSSATVSWTAPVSDGGRPVSGYVVTPYVGYFPLPSQSFSSTATTQAMTGLSPGTQYRFRVQAVNAVGPGAFSKASNLITVPTAPGTPMIGPATGGDGQATASWTAPASNGGSPVTGYEVTPYIGYHALPPQTFASTATTQVVTGLVNGTTYRFRVRAINVVGTGPYSTVTNAVTPSA